MPVDRVKVALANPHVLRCGSRAHAGRRNMAPFARWRVYRPVGGGDPRRQGNRYLCDDCAVPYRDVDTHCLKPAGLIPQR